VTIKNKIEIPHPRDDMMLNASACLEG